MISSEIHLKAVLGYDFKELNNICDHVSGYYYGFNKKQKKKDGSIKIRTITPSKKDLSLIQDRIKSRILDKIILPDYILGGVKKKNSITNAKHHQGKPHHFSTDLKDFFPFINAKMVYAMFIREGFSPDVSRILTRLTTYKGHIPQGTSTSTGIANLVFLPVDQRIVALIGDQRITYTRFVDDLNFSSDIDFKDKVASIVTIITQSGFRISHKKTLYKIGTIEITGAKITQNGLLPTNKILQKVSSANTKPESMAGLLNYIDRLKKA